MTQECTTSTTDTAGASLLEAIEPVELWAERAGGGTLRVTRFHDDQLVGVAIGQPSAYADKVRHIVVSLEEDGADSTCRHDSVAVHNDMAVYADSDGLGDIDRAISALQAAREALLATAVRS